MSGSNPVYVADTHPLVWYLTKSPTLSITSRNLFDEVKANRATLVIPALVLAELLMIVEKGRIALPTRVLTASISSWKKSQNIWLTSLSPEIVLASRKLSAIPDIFDRVIIAEALVLKAPLITKDATITGSQLVKVIW